MSLGLESDEIVDADSPFPLHESQCLAQSRAIERIAQRARIREVRLLAPLRDVLAQRLARVIAQAVFASAAIFSAISSSSSLP